MLRLQAVDGDTRGTFFGDVSRFSIIKYEDKETSKGNSTSATSCAV